MLGPNDRECGRLRHSVAVAHFANRWSVAKSLLKRLGKNGEGRSARRYPGDAGTWFSQRQTHLSEKSRCDTRRLLTGLAMLLALYLSGCGGSGSSPVAVSVGDAVIGARTVAHWTHVIARGGMIDASRREDSLSPRTRALRFLISSAWLDGEARRLGFVISGQAVSRGAAERRTASGEGEFDQSLRATGQSDADVGLEVRNELALAAIRRSLAKRAAAVSDAEAAKFYEDNRKSFVASEERKVDLIETLPSRAAALALVRRVGGGRGFAKKAFHEEPTRASIAKWRQLDKKAVLRAIFAARPGVVSAPMKMSGAWLVFVVRKIRPPRLQSLAEVKSRIVKRLVARRRYDLLASFAREYDAHWTARTNCRPGYVVQGCAQYAGPIAAGENQFASG